MTRRAPSQTSALAVAVALLLGCEPLRTSAIDCGSAALDEPRCQPDDLEELAAALERQHFGIHRLRGRLRGAAGRAVFSDAADFGRIRAELLAGETPSLPSSARLLARESRLLYEALSAVAATLRYAQVQRAGDAEVARTTLEVEIRTLADAVRVTGTSSTVALRVLGPPGSPARQTEDTAERWLAIQDPSSPNVELVGDDREPGYYRSASDDVPQLAYNPYPRVADLVGFAWAAAELADAKPAGSEDLAVLRGAWRGVLGNLMAERAYMGLSVSLAYAASDQTVYEGSVLNPVLAGAGDPATTAYFGVLSVAALHGLARASDDPELTQRARALVPLEDALGYLGALPELVNEPWTTHDASRAHDVFIALAVLTRHALDDDLARAARRAVLDVFDATGQGPNAYAPSTANHALFDILAAHALPNDEPRRASLLAGARAALFEGFAVPTTEVSLPLCATGDVQNGSCQLPAHFGHPELVLPTPGQEVRTGARVRPAPPVAHRPRRRYRWRFSPHRVSFEGLATSTYIITPTDFRLAYALLVAAERAR